MVRHPRKEERVSAKNRRANFGWCVCVCCVNEFSISVFNIFHILDPLSCTIYRVFFSYHETGLTHEENKIPGSAVTCWQKSDKGLSSQSYGFSSSLVRMWELDYKESWSLKNRCFWTVVQEKTLESPLDCKEMKPVNPKGNQSWIFTGRTDAEAETPILWPPDVKNFLEKTLMLERLKAGGERDNRGWDSWMASPTWWTWV